MTSPGRANGLSPYGTFIAYCEEGKLACQFTPDGKAVFYCQTFSTGFSSGARDGRKISVMFLGMSSFAVVCQPARSSSRTAWARRATCRLISSR